jgi:hypothetical protein
MDSQDVPPKQSLNAAKERNAIEELKLWLTEQGIDSSNLEELIMQDCNQNQSVPYEDSKSKHLLSFDNFQLPSCLT